MFVYLNKQLEINQINWTAIPVRLTIFIINNHRWIGRIGVIG